MTRAGQDIRCRKGVQSDQAVDETWVSRRGCRKGGWGQTFSLCWYRRLIHARSFVPSALVFFSPLTRYWPCEDPGIPGVQSSLFKLATSIVVVRLDRLDHLECMLFNLSFLGFFLGSFHWSFCCILLGEFNSISIHPPHRPLYPRCPSLQPLTL